MTLQGSSLFSGNEINLDDDGYQGFQGQNVNTSANISFTGTLAYTNSMYDMIDEDLTTAWTIGLTSTSTNNKGIVFDLGKNMKIRNIALRFRINNSSGGPSHFKIQKSKDNSTWTDIDDITFTTAGTDYDKSYGDHRVRYFRILITQEGATGIYVSIYRVDFYK